MLPPNLALKSGKAYTDTLRRSHIRERNEELRNSLSLVSGGIDHKIPASEAEKEAIKKRFAQTYKLNHEIYNLTKA